MRCPWRQPLKTIWNKQNLISIEALILIRQSQIDYPLSTLQHMREAAHARNIEVGQVLIDLGATVDRCTHPPKTIGRRPQHIAVSRGRPGFIRLLRNNKENPNVSDRLHQTPLDPAVGHATSLKHLDSANRSEAVEAKRSVALANNRSICHLLRSQGGKKLLISSEKKWVQRFKPTRTIQSLIEAGRNFNRATEQQSKIKSGRTKDNFASNLPKRID